MTDKRKIVYLIISLAILIFLLISVYNNVVSVKRANSILTKEMESIAEKNKVPVFTLQKVVLYSSAEYEDLSAEQNLQDVSIHQYTDLAIYIRNNEDDDGSLRSKNTEYELTEENTISELYIDEIKLVSDYDIGTKLINYKSPLDMGKYRTIDNTIERIDYKILHKNEENKNDYSEPTFFTDCSNPITLSVLNKNVLEHCTANNDGTLKLDGSILKNAGVEPEKLNTKISFKIHLKNNLNEEFVANVVVDNEIDETIYEGFKMEVFSASDLDVKFFKKL